LEVILDEYPAFHGPYSRSIRQCLECYKPVDEDNVDVKCPKCNYNVCGDKCANGKVHKTECEVMQRVGYRWEREIEREIEREREKEREREREREREGERETYPKPSLRRMMMHAAEYTQAISQTGRNQAAFGKEPAVFYPGLAYIVEKQFLS
jgi:hypothetical protein